MFFRVDKFKEKINAAGFDIEDEITIKAIKNGLKIKKVPIEYKKRQNKVKIGPWESFKIFKRIFKE